MIDALCARWGCPPSVVLAESTASVRMVAALNLVDRERAG